MPRRCRPRRSRAFFRPLVERLEDRRLLAAVLTVNSTADADARDAFLTLREAILINNRTLAVATLSALEQLQVTGAPTNADTDTINFNILGVGVQTISPTAALPTITDPVTINGYSQAGASANTNPAGQGLNTVLTIELAGNSAGAGANGLQLGTGSGGSTIKGLVINRFAGDGIRVDSSGNILAGNFVGTNPLGSAASANGTGVHVFGANNTVGGTAAADRNLVSGNTVSGLVVEGAGATGNTVQGNLMGTNAAGAAAVPNGGAVGIVNAASGNTIGGTVAGAGNLLSGNTFDGVVTFGAATIGNFIQGNLVGTNVDGTAALANGRHGVWVLQSGSGNTIGGTAAGARNVISGNTQAGVLIESTSGTVIQGNFIGVNAAGQAKLGNVRDGVVIFNGSNTIGGTVAGAGNVIGGNGLPGIAIVGTGSTVVQGNWIGTNAAGANLGNVTTGVLIAESSGNTIGGAPGGNTIAFNGADGIAITARFAGQSVGNQIQANSIYSNGGLGIDLADNGPDFPQGAFNGPGVNNRQDFPILTEVIATDQSTTVSGTLNALNGASKHRIDFFANAAADASGFGEGQTFLASLVVEGTFDIGVTFTATLPALPAGQPLVTTTATDITDRGSGPLNNTSEFSPPFLPPTVYTVTTTADSGAGSLRAAIAAANAHAGFDRIEFAIPATEAGHFYYQDDGVAGQVTLAKVAATTAADDAGLPTTGPSAVDPDWPHAWFSIRPAAALPDIDEPVVIDGYTQAGASANTNAAPQGLNTVLRIEISGQDAGPPPVTFQPGLLRIAPRGAASTIRGLVLNRASVPKIRVVNTTGVRVEGNFVGSDVSGTLAFAGTVTDGIATNLSAFESAVGGISPPLRNLISGNLNGVFIGRNTASVQGNLIGTDRTGTRALGNSDIGVIAGAGATIGGPTPAAANVISGNLAGVLATGGTIQNNLIGTNATGAANVGNRSVGVLISTNGSNTPIVENTIAFNGFAAPSGGIGGSTNPAGIRILGGAVPELGNGNLISRNSIYSNFGPGIDLGDGFVTLNDVPPASTPPDQDTGPNQLQNYPVLKSVTDLNPGTRIQGTLSSTPSSDFRAEFYANPERNEKTLGFFGTYGEGKTLIGTLDVTTDSSGLATFNIDLAVDLLALPGPTGQPFVTATATDITDTGSGPRNNTSEFSLTAPLGGPSFVVTTTADTGLGTLREALYSANLAAGAQTITFAIPASDPRHFYYKDDGIANQLTLSNIAATTAATDAAIPTTGTSAIDPDWRHSWFSIRPSDNLPSIIETITIDGYSQAGSSPNTLPALGPLDTVLKIELDGTNAPGDGLNLGIGGSLNGMVIDASRSTIRGLAINRFGGDGIELDTLDGRNAIVGNFIGTDVSGTLDLGNAARGVFANVETASIVGGVTPISRNLISGNASHGVEITGSVRFDVKGNLLGTDRSSEPTLPNGGSSVFIASSQEFSIGGTEAGAGNVIAVTDRSGVTVQDSNPQAQANLNASQKTADEADENDGLVDLDEPWRLRQLSSDKETSAGNIGKNEFKPGSSTNSVTFEEVRVEVERLNAAAAAEQLGIDLGGDGVTLNDGDNPSTPAIDPDSDSGPNGLQNFPVLTLATRTTGTVITGTLNSLVNTSFRIELYSNTVGVNFRAGEQVLGSLDVTTNAQGNASFTFDSSIAVPAGQFITSIATRLADLDNNPGTPLTPIGTSEFSAVIAVRQNPWHNQAKALDVKADNKIVAGDALEIINYVNAFGSQPVPANAVLGVPAYYDTSNDGSVAPNDALDVINFINAFGAEGEGEGAAAVASPVAQPDTAGQASSGTQATTDDLLGLLASDLAAQPKRRRF